MTHESTPKRGHLPVNGYPLEGDRPADPVWINAYHQAIEVFRLRHDAAVHFADSTLRLTRSQAPSAVAAEPFANRPQNAPTVASETHADASVAVSGVSTPERSFCAASGDLSADDGLGA